MKNYSVFKTEKSALINAKILAIRKFEKSEGITVDDDAIIKSNAWTINDKSCDCNCGGTGAIEAVLIPRFITDDDLAGAYSKEFIKDKLTIGDLSEDSDNDIYYGFTGICENCGE